MSSEHEEREKAAQELQERFQTTADLLNRVAQQERAATVSKQRHELVMSELKAMPESTPTYRQIGRAYFMEPMSGIIKTGEDEVKAAVAEAAVCKKKLTMLEGKLEETRKELQELATAS